MWTARALRTGLRIDRGMRIGLFGGSFDPPHAGHAHVAETASKRLDLDRVIWLVSPQNPLKPGPAPLRARMAAVRRWTRAGTVVSDIERALGARYSIDLVLWLKRRFPAVRFVFVVGSDNFATLHRWRDWIRLMEQIPLAVVARPGASVRALTSPAARRFRFARMREGAGRRLPLAKPPAWIYLAGPWNYASSTALRESADPSART
jgi:nicotinate-nucleotide adenylyltransferase